MSDDLDTGRKDRHRERRWLLLAEEGSHSWLGRAIDPEDEDIGHAEASLRQVGLGGWIVVSEGDYWRPGPMVLLEVRTLNAPKKSFDEAMVLFLSRRQSLLGGIS